VRRHHRATNTIHYAYFHGIEADRFWFQFTPGVNAGLIPTNDDTCLVFAGRPAHLRRRFTQDPDGEFFRLLEQAGSDLAGSVRAGSRSGKFRGTSGLAGFIRQAWGPGWALVGDAGYTKDPISAHGISDALRDAELCARAVDRSLRHPEEATEAMQAYETVRDSLSDRMFEESRELARFHWDADEASSRMRVISDQVRAECDTLVSLPAWHETPVLSRA
jgi:2-polyprenyl-6-methoxyphenol hydroxylase-like FAD-dependent oxidoreductase